MLHCLLKMDGNPQLKPLDTLFQICYIYTQIFEIWKLCSVSHTDLIFISMKKVETKDKGDVGVAMVIADLTSKGYKIALPISEHLPFDVVVISPQGKLARISVKYSGDKTSAKIALRTISSNSSGYVVKRVNPCDIDGFAVYSSVSNQCYYLPVAKVFGKRNTVGIRLSDTTNCTNEDQILFAKNFLNPECLFMADCRNGNGPDLKSEAS